jgi:type II secretory ATPase GspE/PulE/Tfp pilus assembly ATPase PilB-like protein
MSSLDPSSSNLLKSDSQARLAEQSQPVTASEINTDESFWLIDYMLPYPACFYHQLLPLGLTQQNLTVAMVDSDDSSALDFLVSILESMDQVPKLKIRIIDKDILAAILSAYLSSHRSTQDSENNFSNQKTLLQDQKPYRKQEQSTLILEENEFQREKQKLTLSSQAQTQLQPPTPLKKQESFSSRSLNIHPQHLSAPPEFLTSLPPQQLLIEMLGRVLMEGGIGRLYFERNANQGRILCSQNGIAQVTVENVPVGLFQGTINELKKMARIRPEPIQKTRKFDIAQYYQGKALLLRIRLMPGKNGEEATLQVLRGKALSFYQRQQIEKIAQESLQIAKQLERKVTQITLRQRFNQDPVVAVSQLKKLLSKLAQQLDTME